MRGFNDLVSENRNTTSIEKYTLFFAGMQLQIILFSNFKEVTTQMCIQVNSPITKFH